MQEFIKNLTSTSWWIGVVIVGIILNLVSSYLKPFLDDTMSKISSSKKALSEKQAEEWKSLVAAIKNDQHAYMVEAFRDLRHRNKALALFIMSILLFALSQQFKANPALYIWPFKINLEILFAIIDIGTMLIASFCMITGINHYKRAKEITRALNEAATSAD